MIVRHVDLGGEPWAFSIDCTPYERELLTRVLASVRGVGGRASLTMTYHRENAEPFCLSIERALLSGLARAYPVNPEPPQAPTPTYAIPPAPVPNTNPELLLFENDNTPEEPDHAYYWERF